MYFEIKTFSAAFRYRHFVSLTFILLKRHNKKEYFRSLSGDAQLKFDSYFVRLDIKSDHHDKSACVFLCVYLCMCMCVCVCVCKRERKRAEGRL